MPFPDSEYPSILRGKDKRESQRLPAAANARLMAAGPDLLAALDSIRSSLMELDDDGCGRPGCGWREMDATHVDELISNSLRLAIDAIAKVEERE